MDEEQEVWLLWRLISAPCCILEIDTTPSLGHAVLTSALKPMLFATMSSVVYASRSVICKMSDGTNYQLLNQLDAENVNLTNVDWNTSIGKPENC